MLVARFLARLFDKLCQDAVIKGLRFEVEMLKKHEARQEALMERMKKKIDYQKEIIDDDAAYYQALMKQFEAFGSMTFAEFTIWHNKYTEQINKQHETDRI